MEISLIFLCESKNGVRVFFDPIHSHVATHFQDAPQLKQVAIEAISSVVLHGGEVATQVDMGRVVGTCDVIVVRDEDEIVYAVRKNREDDGLIPFVKDRKGDPCSSVALHLIPQKDDTYILSSAWIGPMNDDDEPFPQSLNATARSREYWDRHAFVYGSQAIIHGTETKQKPW